MKTKKKKSKVDLEKLRCDLLKEVYEGRITEKKARKLFFKIHGTPPFISAEFFYLNSMEMSPIVQVPFENLAKWRYEGWPKKCLNCGGKLVAHQFGWFPERDANKNWGLVHLICPPGENKNEKEMLKRLIKNCRKNDGRKRWYLYEKCRKYMEKKGGPIIWGTKLCRNQSGAPDIGRKRGPRLSADKNPFWQYLMKQFAQGKMKEGHEKGRPNKKYYMKIK